MLDRCIGERMAFKNLPNLYQIAILVRYWYLVDFKLRESLYIEVIIWVNTILMSY